VLDSAPSLEEVTIPGTLILALSCVSSFLTSGQLLMKFCVSGSPQFSLP